MDDTVIFGTPLVFMGTSDVDFETTHFRVSRAYHKLRINNWLKAQTPTMRYYGTEAAILGSLNDIKTLQRIGAMLREDDYDFIYPATCALYAQALFNYRAFPKLYGERINARNYSSNAYTSGLNIMDLAAELRIEIFRHLLVEESEIEVRPYKVTGRFGQFGNDYTDRNARKAMNHYWRQKCKALRVLRVNKTFNLEASSVYYGEHEFRFTDKYGWHSLWAFLDLIGPTNISRLRRLVAPCPWTVVPNTDTGTDTNTATDSIERGQSTSLSVFKEPWRRDSAIVALVCAKLEASAAAGLTTLSLALFDDHKIMPTVSPLPLDLTKFTSPSFKIRLLHCSDARSNRQARDDQHHSQIEFALTTTDSNTDTPVVHFSRVQDAAEKLGWEYMFAPFLRGRYPILYYTWFYEDGSKTKYLLDKGGKYREALEGEMDRCDPITGPGYPRSSLERIFYRR